MPSYGIYFVCYAYLMAQPAVQEPCPPGIQACKWETRAGQEAHKHFCARNVDIAETLSFRISPPAREENPFRARRVLGPRGVAFLFSGAEAPRPGG